MKGCHSYTIVDISIKFHLCPMVKIFFSLFPHSSNVKVIYDFLDNLLQKKEFSFVEDDFNL